MTHVKEHLLGLRIRPNEECIKTLKTLTIKNQQQKSCGNQ
jgi:hypothetical protein